MTERDFNQWLNEPSFEESVCSNPFHDITKKVFDGYGMYDPYQPDPGDVRTKVAQLLKAGLVILEGDVIYIKEHYDLHPLNEAVDLLAYYMHADSNEARKAANLLETNFQGYFPVTQHKVLRDAISIVFDGASQVYDLKTLEPVDPGLKIPEFGCSEVVMDHFGPLAQYFTLVNQAVGEPYFFEKMLLYPFTQHIREKSHVLVGGGGNGKSLFMKMVQRLYGQKSITDAPQPNFSGHSAGVIAYNFIGKRVVTFNDVGDPSAQFLEWMKRMITGNLEVKTPSGQWLSIPCRANFFMETNHQPEILDLEAHRRRFIIREFDPGFKLADWMSSDELDVVGDRGEITAADVVMYLLQVKDQIDDWTKFGPEPPTEGEQMVELVKQQMGETDGA
ncbi:DUF5906 domain-containing protein [uncultured Bifidobacterium sp.]|uniref:DUF5906 domain-containing protein n=1 Tax=uncultured Bifidobacterium sp. TaxID=165187 RepID=UPI00260F566F|nr:DUF5906 domain-containing protein [uncultured Bifidobacterium sp.]